MDEARRAHRAGRLKQVIGAYRKAVQLYRGPLFEDDGAGEWYLPEQRRLRDLYGQALEEVAEIHFERGELSEAVHFGQLAISNDPCSEAIHRLLMRCYASQHQQQLVSRQVVTAGVLAANPRTELVAPVRVVFTVGGAPPGTPLQAVTRIQRPDGPGWNPRDPVVLTGPGQAEFDLTPVPAGDHVMALIAWAPDATAKPVSVTLPSVTIRPEPG